MKICYLQLQSNRHICPYTSIVDEIFLSTIVDDFFLTIIEIVEVVEVVEVIKVVEHGERHCTLMMVCGIVLGKAKTTKVGMN